MPRIRIQGLVRIAAGVRRELPAGVDARRLATIRAHVQQALAEVRQLLVAGRADLTTLPGPSRQAYRFLADIDWSAPTAALAAQSPARHNVSFGGLKTFIDSACDSLGRAASAADIARTQAAIKTMCEKLQKQIEADSLSPCHLAPQTRLALGWLAMMSQDDRFEAYMEALAAALPLLQDAVHKAGVASQVVLRYRPISALFRYRVNKGVMTIELPTAMITLDPPHVRRLPAFVLRRRNRPAILAATRSEAYRDLERELERLGGNGDQAAGVYHDLDASFARVNGEYFGGLLPRPRLSWSRSPTTRKFGHYDELHDVIVVSCALDQSDVSPLAVDYVMYHELLHKKLGIRYSGGRKSAHTSAFAVAEKQFGPYDQAKAVLDRLARTGRA